MTTEKSEENLEKNPNNPIEIKLYRVRWVVIGIFALYAAASAMQWIQYSIITNIIMKYYNVSSLTVAWTSMIAMVTYPPLLLPGCYLVDRAGLRVCALLGVAGTALGAWIKLFSLQPHLFWVGFLGQTVNFCAQIFILSLPPKIAAVWFGPNEVSTASSLGVFGTQAGTAAGFILSPFIVRNHDNLDDIGRDLSYLFYGVCAFVTPLVVLVWIFVKPEPPLPPSKAQAQLKLDKVEFNSKDFWKSYKDLMTNKPFMLLSVAYGTNIGTFASLGTMLNQFILEYFPNGEKDAGTIGLVQIVIGTVGIVIFGIFLDRTKRYKETAVGLQVMTTVGVAAFMISLETHNKVLVYISACILGFFQNAYYPAGFEFGVELSYPIPESSSSGIMISASQICGVIFTLVMESFQKKYGTFWSLATIDVFLIVGCVITVFVPNRLYRQEALGTTVAEKKPFLKKKTDS